jgi:hypothetical protein
VQFAEKLLARKALAQGRAAEIAHKLVHAYKAHSFVIDFDEARELLGASWVLSDTTEIKFAEGIHDLLSDVNLWFRLVSDQRFALVGSLDKGVLVFNTETNSLG